MKQLAKRIKKFVLFGAILCLSHAGVWAQMADPPKVLLQEGLGIFPYKEFVHEPYGDSVDWLSVNAMSVSDVAKDFNDSRDMDWLQLPPQTRGVLIGETHNLRYLNHLKSRIIFYLAQTERIRHVFIEEGFGYTPLINHFTQIEDAFQARQFFIEYMNNWVVTREDSVFYEQIRRWNSLFPDQSIKIYFYDVVDIYEIPEQWRKMVSPYLKQAGITHCVKSNYINEISHQLPYIIKKVEGNKTHSIDVGGAHLTRQFILNLLHNMQAAIHGRLNDYDLFRQQIIVRNLIDSDYYGSILAKSKFVIYGGSYHMAKKVAYPADLAFLREGSFLNQYWDKTKDRIVSILLEPGGMKVNRELTLSTGFYLPQSVCYHDLSTRVRAAWGYGLVDLGEKCFTDFYPSCLDIKLSAFGIDHSMNAYIIKNLDWDYLKNSFTCDNQEIREKQQRFSWYDYIIYVPFSPATTPRSYPGLTKKQAFYEGE